MGNGGGLAGHARRRTLCGCILCSLYSFVFLQASTACHGDFRPSSGNGEKLGRLRHFLCSSIVLLPFSSWSLILLSLFFAVPHSSISFPFDSGGGKLETDMKHRMQAPVSVCYLFWLLLLTLCAISYERPSLG